jgi:hypothetical protein
MRCARDAFVRPIRVRGENARKLSNKTIRLTRLPLRGMTSPIAQVDSWHLRFSGTIMNHSSIVPMAMALLFTLGDLSAQEIGIKRSVVLPELTPS